MKFDFARRTYRGVAQLVARCVRDAEAWSSSLHTPTKRKTVSLGTVFCFGHRMEEARTRRARPQAADPVSLRAGSGPRRREAAEGGRVRSSRIGLHTPTKRKPCRQTRFFCNPICLESGIELVGPMRGIVFHVNRTFLTFTWKKICRDGISSEKRPLNSTFFDKFRQELTQFD